MDMKGKENLVKWKSSKWLSFLVNETRLFSVYRILILYTPQTPRSIKYFSLVALIMPQFSYCQTSSIPVDFDSIKVGIEERYNELTAIEIEEYEELKKYKFMNYIPSLGYSTFTGINIYYNFYDMMNFFKDKKIKKAKTRQVEEKYKAKAELEYLKYLHLTKKKENLLSEIAAMEEIMILENRLFAITAGKYKNIEIKPSEYIQKEIDYKKKVLALEKLNMQLHDILFELTYFEKTINAEL